MTSSPAPANGHAREAAILRNMPLAESLAEQEHRKLPPWIGLDEARSAAYLALVQAVDRFDPEGHPGVPLGAWVRKPIRGAVRELGRRASAKLSWVPQDEEPKERLDATPSPESLAAYEEFRRAVWRRVDALPPRLALVVRMRYCGEMDYRQIGRVMRKPLSVKRVQFLRGEALRMLRSEA